MCKISITIILLSLLLFPHSIQASEGIPLQKDVLLSTPIFGPEDLPEEITFNLYNSQTAAIPIGTQTFARGQYTVEFEFSKSDGITSGNVARLTANFTNKLNISDSADSSAQPKELWVDLAFDGTETGIRKHVSDETMVQLLLASDASISTYLTLVYEGDDNPITTIYRNLPLSFKSPDSSEFPFNSYLSSVLSAYSSSMITPNAVAGSDGQIQYNNGGVEGGASQFYYDDTNHRVGIGTSGPGGKLEIAGSSGVGLVLDETSHTKGLNWSATDGILRYDTHSWAAGHALEIFDKLSSTVKVHLDIAGNSFFDGGNVGIGTTNPTYKLAVNGTIRAKEIIVDTGWSDFVFGDNYRLTPLSEVEQFIAKKKHLPGIPTATDVKENGVTLGNISSKLLQKIEELTLYVIDLKKENDSLRGRLALIEKQLNGHPN